MTGSVIDNQTNMAKTILKKDSVIENLERIIKGLNAPETPRWLADWRQNGLRRFTALGFPTIKDEEWKYTNLSAIAEKRFQMAGLAALKKPAQLMAYCAHDPVLVVFVNGRLSQEFSRLGNIPKGIRISTIKEAVKSDEKKLKELLTKYDTQSESVFAALNKALTDDGVIINVDDKIVSEELIHIVQITDADQGEIIANCRSLIQLGISSEATILESHLAFSDDITYWVNALTDVFLAENAVLHYCKAQKESLQAFHIGQTRVWQERNSNLDSFSVMVGGSITRNNLDVVINGEGANALLDGLYAVNGTQHVDNHTSVDHQLPNCTSNQLYKGILNGASRAVFNGKIYVRAIAQKTNSYQLNKNLLLGNESRVDTKPQLEIHADDVKCTHGATIGQLNEDEIFYLQSRCIAKRDAVKMLSKGFVDDILNKIQHPEIRRKMSMLLEPTFAAL